MCTCCNSLQYLENLLFLEFDDIYCGLGEKYSKAFIVCVCGGVMRITFAKYMT